MYFYGKVLYVCYLVSPSIHIYSFNINITKQQSINIAVNLGLSIGPRDSRQGHRFAFYYIRRNVVGNEYMKVDL